jgi:hypothetical protein
MTAAGRPIMTSRDMGKVEAGECPQEGGEIGALSGENGGEGEIRTPGEQ